MKRLIVLLILVSCFLYSCRQEKPRTVLKRIETKTVNDTIIKSPTIILVMPNEKEIERLKEKHGEENFYISADDASFYMAEINRKVKNKDIIFSSKNSYFFDHKNVKITKSDFKDPWFIIDYTSDKPLKYSLVDYYSKISNKTKTLSVFENNKDFFIENIDINNDGVLDKIVSSKPYKGNSLYFFCKKNNSYVLSLESVNFSEDGGNIIKNIYPSTVDKKTFLLHTVFPDGGNFQAFHYIEYNGSNNWKLNKTRYEKTDWQDSKTYICDVKQGIDMKDFISGEGFKHFNSIPKKASNSEMCNIKN